VVAPERHLIEANLSDFEFELLCWISEVLNSNVDHRQSGRFDSGDLEDCLVPAVVLLLAAVGQHVVLEPAAVPDLQVVPGHEGDSLPQVAADVLIGDGVETVVGDLLLGLGGEQLEEAHLVTVRLVREVEVGVGLLADPHLLLLGDDVDLR